MLKRSLTMGLFAALLALLGCDQRPEDPNNPRTDGRLDEKLGRLWNQIKPDGKRFDKVRIGESTESDVVANAGEPSIVWREPDGTRTLEYPRGPEGATTWMVRIGLDGKVTAIEQVLNAAQFAKLQAGMKKEEVRRLLGKPGQVQKFALKKEEVWSWRWQEESTRTALFNAHFDEDGVLTQTSRSDDPRHTGG